MKNTVSIHNIAIKVFFCSYIASGILFFATLDFCSNHPPELSVVLFSFGSYILIAVITESELFFIKDIYRLKACLAFWVINFSAFCFAYIFSSFDAISLMCLLVLAPSAGIINIFRGDFQKFIFPIFCLLESIHVAFALWRCKHSNTKKGTRNG